MAELIEQAEEDTSERQSPALTAALSAILAEVKDSEPVDLDELETGEEPDDGRVIEDNDDNESIVYISGHTLDLVIARFSDHLGISTPWTDYLFSDHMPVYSKLQVYKPALKNRI